MEDAAAESALDSLLQQLAKMDAEAWFAKPVDPVALDLPDYFQVVRRPMDLGTVHSGLAQGAYKDDSEVRALLLLRRRLTRLARRKSRLWRIFSCA
jgi:hypothetical protein